MIELLNPKSNDKESVDNGHKNGSEKDEEFDNSDEYSVPS